MYSLLLTMIVSGIIGPASIPAGDLFELRSDKLATEYAWTVIPAKTFFQADGGSRVAFASGKPGTYTFVMAANIGGKLEIFQHVVVVGGEPPSPPIPPSPGPSPIPTPPSPGPSPGPSPPTPPAPPPDGPLGLTRFAFDEIMKLPPAARLKSSAVGDCFSSLAAQISAGTLGGFAIGKKTREAFNAACGDQLEAWKAVDAAVQGKLRLLANEKKVKNTADLADAYREIAAGAEAVK